ncbi:MAG: hypothetical protein DRR06_01050 [Gammaproteobacteria bacterium]|nr:MAG: hypothetical protein DRR06_01050 [Gammaproteobacteria bacterium]RLA54936.1 MAG: hypothetical protein DRR42_00085 [Gammaproteobacteria bacterium]
MSALEYYRIDTVNVAWIWTHWGQWAAIKTPADLAELKHIISLWYSTPPMSTTWEKSPIGKNLLDENFVSFVDEILKEKRAESKTEASKQQENND